MKNISIVVFAILSLVMCGQKNPINISKINTEIVRSTGDQEIDVLIIKLKKSMQDYMKEANPSYSQKEVDECISILSEYTISIYKSQSKKEGMEVVKSTVLKLNALNEKCNLSLIETNEREQIVEIIILASHRMKYNFRVEDITEEWREW